MIPVQTLRIQLSLVLRIQSVSDVERLFRAKMEEFMKQKGYELEEFYIRVVRNWRRSYDEHGLTNQERELQQGISWMT